MSKIRSLKAEVIFSLSAVITIATAIFAYYYSKTSEVQFEEYYQETSEMSSSVLVALVLGIATLIANFVGIIIIHRLGKQNLLLQLEEGRKSAEQQIKSAHDIAMKQIENSFASAKLDFNKTVLSGNRQAWINDLREIISTILSHAIECVIRKDLKFPDFKELYKLITKAELMLNAAPEKDKNFIDALQKLNGFLFLVAVGKGDISEADKHINAIKDFARETLKTEWERVKKGE